MLSDILTAYAYCVVATTILIIWGWPKHLRDSETVWSGSTTRLSMSLAMFRTIGLISFIVLAPLYLLGVFVIDPIRELRYGDD